MRDGPGARVPSFGHKPELNMIACGCCESNRMTRADIVIIRTMDQQHWNVGTFERIEWAGLKQIDPVAQACIDHGRGNHRPAQRPSEPRL